VPSHLFEYFARSPEVVSQWARHHITGEPVPIDVLRGALAHKDRSFSACNVQTQILYSAADQFLFGAEMNTEAISHLSHSDIYARGLAGVAEAQQQLTSIPLYYCREAGAMRPNMNLLSHGHFINYGGGYYSYLVSGGSDVVDGVE
jgi:Zn-dependent oligopeptidase